MFPKISSVRQWLNVCYSLTYISSVIDFYIIYGNSLYVITQAIIWIVVAQAPFSKLPYMFLVRMQLNHTEQK